MVVIIAPVGKTPPCMLQTVEDLLVETLIAKPGVEALDEGVLLLVCAP